MTIPEAIIEYAHSTGLRYFFGIPGSGPVMLAEQPDEALDALKTIL